MRTDAELVELFLNRDESAVSEVVDKYKDYCFTIAYNILENVEDSEECVNDVWLKLWSSVPPEVPRNLQAYIAKLCRNIALDRYRFLHTEKRGGSAADIVLSEIEECLAGGTNPEHEVIAKELEDSINIFLKKLPKRDAGVFIRRYFLIEPVERIAEHFGISENNTTVILSRVRSKLRKYLIKKGYIIER